MDLAIRAMLRDGTVAAGDVSNGLTSLPIKKGGQIQWHTFVEVFETDDAAAQETIRKGMSLYEAFSGFGKTSLVPHSPYSVSPALLRLIGGRAVAAQETLSIHHLETAGELEFFTRGSGPVAESLRAVGQELPASIPAGQRPLDFILPLLRGIRRLLLVNNVYASQEDVLLSQQQAFPVTWVLCPGSNLFLEGRIPDVPLLRKHKLHIALGTESLASCRTLSILRQMKIIQDHYREVPFSEMAVWATWNGAQALGLEDQLGRIKAGTRPGLLQVTGLEGERITRKTKVTRLH
jgi:cytosine/adenosine deaminase-related metal-dependent hydrolase